MQQAMRDSIRFQSEVVKMTRDSIRFQSEVVKMARGYNSCCRLILFHSICKRFLISVFPNILPNLCEILYFICYT